MPGRDDVERGPLAGRADDGDADAVVAAGGEADLRGEQRLTAALLGAPEQPRPVAAAHVARRRLAQLLAGVAGDAARERLPELLTRRRAHHGRVVELLVREQCVVLSAAGSAEVAHAVHGRMLGAR